MLDCYVITYNYAFCNLIRALRSGSCGKKSRSKHQTLSLFHLRGGSGYETIQGHFIFPAYCWFLFTVEARNCIFVFVPLQEARIQVVRELLRELNQEKYHNVHSLQERYAHTLGTDIGTWHSSWRTDPPFIFTHTLQPVEKVQLVTYTYHQHKPWHAQTCKLAISPEQSDWYDNMQQ